MSVSLVFLLRLYQYDGLEQGIQIPLNTGHFWIQGDRTLQLQMQLQLLIRLAQTHDAKSVMSNRDGNRIRSETNREEMANRVKDGNEIEHDEELVGEVPFEDPRKDVL